MQYRPIPSILFAACAAFAIFIGLPLNGQVAPAAPAISFEDQSFLTDLAGFLKSCSADQISWLAKTRVFVDEPEQELKVKMVRAGKGEFYGQVWTYVVGLKQMEKRSGETAHKSTIAQLAAGLSTDRQAALGIVRYQHFSDQQGREIEAELLRVDGQKVIAAFKDGREFEMPVASLIDEDREMVEAWIEKQVGAGTRTLVTAAELQFAQKRATVVCPYPDFVPEKFHKGSTLEGTGYEVTVENRGRSELPPLSAHYYVFYHVGSQAGNSNTKHVRGEVAISKLRAREDYVFLTAGGHPFDRILKQYIESGSDDDAVKERVISGLIQSIEKNQSSSHIPDVKLSGLWLRVYSGQNRVAEHVVGSAAEEAREHFNRPRLTTSEYEFPDGPDSADSR